MGAKLKITCAACFALLSAACGYTDSGRISGGGALGGAAVGGLTGAVAGGATEPETVNLGRPPWSNPNVRVPGVGQR